MTRLRAWLALQVDTLLVLMLLCHLFILAAPLHWFFNLFSHFRVPGLVGAALLLPLVLLLKTPKTGKRWQAARISLCLACLAWNAVILAPYWPLAGSDKGAQACLTQDPASGVTIASLNPHLPNMRNPDSRAALLADIPEATDIIVLTELGPDGLAVVKALQARYPHKADAQPVNIFGLTILSRYPITEQGADYGGGVILPVLHARIDTPSGALTVIALHPPPPMEAAFARAHAQVMANAARLAAETDGPHIVTGDINASPFGQHFKALIKQASLDDPRQTHGYIPTWPDMFGIIHPFIPIDHILTRQAPIQCMATLPIKGSDHRGILAKVGVTVLQKDG